MKLYQLNVLFQNYKFRYFIKEYDNKFLIFIKTVYLWLQTMLEIRKTKKCVKKIDSMIQ